MRTRRFLVFGLAAILAAPATALGDTEAESTTPGEETRRAVIRLMRENRAKFGDDAAIMQGLLLVHANMAGAILATESTIVGFEDRERKNYVAFRVDSGAIFDDKSSTAEDRLAHVWQTILERTLRRYPTFSVPADGIAVEIQYSHRPFASISELYDSIDEIGVIERAKFYLSGKDLREFVERRLGSQGLLERSVVLLDEERVTPVIPEFVGPPDLRAPGADAASPFH